MPDEHPRPDRTQDGQVQVRSGTFDFDALYATTPPWDIGRPQAALAALAAEGAWTGRVLDAGCGTGEHALLAAELGLDVTGFDAAPKAIALAEQKARDRGLTTRFVVADALDLAPLGGPFDTAIDSGLFHVFGDEDRARYVAELAGVVRPGGRLHLLCFSDRVPGDSGPRRISQPELRTAFADGWQIEVIRDVHVEATILEHGVPGWCATIARA